MIKMLTELTHGIIEFIAEIFKNWDMETRIRHLFRERSENTNIHGAKILQICWVGEVSQIIKAQIVVSYYILCVVVVWCHVLQYKTKSI